MLLKAYLHTDTTNENKDHDTCIHGFVVSKDGQTRIAHADNADCSIDTDEYQFKDWSDYDTQFVVDKPGLKKSACVGYRAHVWQHTHGGAGHDTWRLKPRFVLEFSDGTELSASPDGGDEITLNSNGTGDKPCSLTAQPDAKG